MGKDEWLLRRVLDHARPESKLAQRFAQQWIEGVASQQDASRSKSVTREKSPGLARGGNLPLRGEGILRRTAPRWPYKAHVILYLQGR
jgi:hypothetical protein